MRNHPGLTSFASGEIATGEADAEMVIQFYFSKILKPNARWVIS